MTTTTELIEALTDAEATIPSEMLRGIVIPLPAQKNGETISANACALTTPTGLSVLLVVQPEAAPE